MTDRDIRDDDDDGSVAAEDREAGDRVAPGLTDDRDPDPDRESDDYEPAPRVDAGPTAWSFVVPVVAVAGALVWAYFAEFRRLWETWGQDPNYSHGYLVPLVAALIVWQRKPGAPKNVTAPWPWGWLIVVVSLVGHGYAYENGFQWTGTVSLLPLLAGLTLALGGWGLFRVVWPGLAFLLFMIPLPNRINAILSQPLQGLAAEWSGWILQLSGLWVVVDGNVIYVGRHPLNVAEACNGLSMMMCLLATVAAAVLLVKTTFWVRLILLLSAVPIALATNVIRIVATGWCVHRLGAEAGARLGHDAAGWLMMPTALVLVGLEVLLLRWIVSEEVVVQEPMLLGKPISKARPRDPERGPEALPGAGS